VSIARVIRTGLRYAPGMRTLLPSILCMLALGCAADPVVGNAAPTIESTNIPSGHSVTMDGDGTLFFVVAEDPEGEDLTFTWAVSDIGEVQGEAIPGGSQVELEPDPAFDGQVLTCVVSDGEKSTRVSWTLVVGE
jgi:hypothetical protein